MSITKPCDETLASSANHETDVSRGASTLNEKLNDTHDDEKKRLLEDETEPRPAHATSSDAPSNDEPLTTKALQFASSASASTLAGIAVGFAAVVYLILGRIGLVLIGAFAGVLGFIAWEARNPEISKIVRGEQGIDVLERLHLDRRSARLEKEDNKDEDDGQFSIKALDEFRPETREALGGLIDAVIKDYVKWWYSPLIPKDHSFPLACRKTLTSYVLAMSNHVYRKRPADAFLDLLTNASSMIIVFMSELASAFADLPAEANLSAADTVSHYIAEHPECHLANLLNTRQQSARFRTVGEDLLRFLDSDSRSCDPARLFLREIISNSILENLLQKCSKAEWINGWIVYLLEAGEPDLNQAIDVGMQTGRDSMPNAFADMDGNVGNIGIAKPPRSSLEADKGRRKEATQAHRKKLSKADEEMEVAIEEMKKLNELIAADEQRRRRASTIRESSERPRPDLIDVAAQPSSDNSKQSPQGKSSDGASTQSDAAPTPLTPQSGADSSSQGSPPGRPGGAQFTNFDQVAPKARAEDGEEGATPQGKLPLTLHNASFTLHDDASSENARIRSKPIWDYLIQVEPSSDAHSGWMIVRRYSDFETLHEILRRIAAISGATAFTELHKELPSWKIHTRESLRGELERYLRDACWYQSLAESEGMKRFLEKSQSHTHGASKSFGWETVGKNMLDVLTIAPKGAMEGGKTLVDGMQGVFGNFPGLSRRANTSHSIDLTSSASRLSLSTPPRMENPKSPARSDRASLDSQRSSVISQQPGKMAPMDRRTSYQSQPGDPDSDYFRMGRSERIDSLTGASSARASREHSRASSLAALRSPSSISLDKLNLPPHPDEISDDYEFPAAPGVPRSQSTDNLANATNNVNSPNSGVSPAPLSGKRLSKAARQYSQLSESETHVAVELIFAVINEMYTLSSAWNIRRTLLAAAKSFLLRPGNPSLLTVQSLIQTSVLDANTSDAGIAAQLRKVRENAMPSEKERANWPAELTDEEKEKLRVKARQLLIRSGVPAALMGVMGQAATSEALGRVFDCLQIEEVARGFVFGLLLQVVRLVTD